jgi:hypothetical protein
MLVVRPLVSRVALRTRPHTSRAVSYGQPLPQSHPHILSAGQLTPGIPAIEYEQRRQKLMHALPDDSIVVSVAAPMKYMSGSECLSTLVEFLLMHAQKYCKCNPQLPTYVAHPSASYKYRQASDFWYLTGVEEPDSAVILGNCPIVLRKIAILTIYRKNLLVSRLPNDSVLTRQRLPSRKVGRCKVCLLFSTHSRNFTSPEEHPSRMPKRYSPQIMY